MTDKAQKDMLLWGGITALGMAIVVGTALGFEHIGGYIPCKLCLGQREPYYIAVPVALVAMAHLKLTGRTKVFRTILYMVAAIMLYSVYLGGFHAGVEWGFWPGPADCGATALGVQVEAGNLLSTIDSVKPPSCDEAAGRFLGLSFAGWNVIASVILAGMALKTSRLHAS